MPSSFAKVGLWLFALLVALAAAEAHPRSTSLLDVLTQLEDELPSCAVGFCPVEHWGNRVIPLALT